MTRTKSRCDVVCTCTPPLDSAFDSSISLLTRATFATSAASASHARQSASSAVARVAAVAHTALMDRGGTRRGCARHVCTARLLSRARRLTLFGISLCMRSIASMRWGAGRTHNGGGASQGILPACQVRSTRKRRMGTTVPKQRCHRFDNASTITAVARSLIIGLADPAGLPSNKARECRMSDRSSSRMSKRYHQVVACQIKAHCFVNGMLGPNARSYTTPFQFRSALYTPSTRSNKFTSYAVRLRAMNRLAALELAGALAVT